MATQSASNVSSLSAGALIQRICTAFRSFPDHRQASNNRRYAIADAAMSAFAVFFTQSPSFLDYQVRMQKRLGRNNAASLFGVHKIPCDNQIRKLLDPVSPATLFPAMAEIGADLYRQGYLEPWRSVGGTLLLVLDGTDSFSSEHICCVNCSHETGKNGVTRYRHICITPILAAPGANKVIPLPPQFVEPQDASAKQDCELGAARRWLAQWGPHYAPWRVTVMGDDLYCHQPLCQQVLAQGFEFIFTCKPDSHVELYDWLADLERCGQVRTVTRMSRSGKYGRQRASETYRYARHLPLRNSDDALMVNWCELTITEPSGKVLYRNSWATSHPIDDSNVEALACAGRTRWKIENENNNVLKTRGYHFEHNYGHGKKHLANLLTTMILLAFLMHTILDWVDEAYQAVRKLLPSRRTFFEHLRALLQYLPFDNWAQLTSFMLARLTDIEPETG